MNRMKLRSVGLALALTAAIALPLAPAHAQKGSVDASELIAKLLPSVVRITTESLKSAGNGSAHAAAVEETDDYSDIEISAGSGFVIDADGTIMTNWHVVAGAYKMTVSLSDGQELDAEVVDAIRLIDLAIIKVKSAKPLQPVTLGDSDTLAIGQPVMAIGNPLGVGMSVSMGIVSALHRRISDTPFDNFIQTDAAINHGNSGGPMFNLKGEVVGVDSAIISPTAANAGLGFALPINQAKFALKQLKEYGWIRPGFLGMRVQDISVEMSRTLGIPLQGALVAWVAPGTSADKSGIQVGDVVTRFQTMHPEDERALRRFIAASKPGSEVSLGVLRGGKEIEIKAKLDEWPKAAWEAANVPLKVPQPVWQVPTNLGITLASLSNETRLALSQVAGAAHGVLVMDVVPGTDASRRRLAKGDIILRVNDKVVDSDADVRAEIDAARKAGKTKAMFLTYPHNPGNSPYAGATWHLVRIASGED